MAGQWPNIQIPACQNPRVQAYPNHDLKALSPFQPAGCFFPGGFPDENGYTQGRLRDIQQRNLFGGQCDGHLFYPQPWNRER